MCTTDYIVERAQVIERAAQGKIEIIDSLLPYVLIAASKAESLPRGGGLLVMLLEIQQDLIGERAAALKMIEEASEIRNRRQEV